MANTDGLFHATHEELIAWTKTCPGNGGGTDSYHIGIEGKERKPASALGLHDPHDPYDQYGDHTGLQAVWNREGLWVLSLTVFQPPTQTR